MTLATKAKALEKLSLFAVKIGYPDKWRDYSALKIDPSDLLGNVRRANAFRWDYYQTSKAVTLNGLLIAA
jgi:putative endopeptidase